MVTEREMFLPNQYLTTDFFLDERNVAFFGMRNLARAGPGSIVSKR